MVFILRQGSGLSYWGCNFIVAWWYRDQSRYVPSQWEMSLQCNDISHWLGTYLDWSLVIWCCHSHLRSFATPPPRVAVRRREVIRHADGRGWEKMEKVEFRNFLSITSRKSYCISKIIIFATVPRWLTCNYSPRNNTMSHLLPAVIWWPSSRCICRCLLIGGNLNSIKFLWRYLMS